MLSKFKRILPRLVNQAKSPFATAGGKDISARNVKTGVARRERLQFSKDRLTEFGDLPVGEIPEALRYDRPVEVSQLNNGVRVASQNWPGELATISVFVKAGSRQETIETSGVSHFLEHLNLRGTKNRNRNQLELDIGSTGSQLNIHTTREVTTYTLTATKKDLSLAVDILGDIIANSTYDKNQIEAERETVHRACVDAQKDQMYTTVEAAYYTSFRDHMMGQPLLGIRENIGNITQEQIVEYHRTNYIGPNVVIVGAGDITHQQLTELAEKSLGGLPGSIPSGLEVKNADRPLFTPSYMLMRDDEMANINVGVFYEAPTWTHEDFFAFHLFQRLLGEYRQDLHTGQHLNSSERQYNSLHALLGSWGDLTIHHCQYTPYSDTALFGSYLHGNEVHAFQMLYVSQIVASDFANYLNEVEVFRAKNRLYNQLLQNETGQGVAHDIGNQLLYLNRTVPRSEVATRISNIEQPHLSRVARNWLFDTEVSAVAWGPIHALMTTGHYNRPLKRSTLGWYADAHLHIN